MKHLKKYFYTYTPVALLLVLCVALGGVLSVYAPPGSHLRPATANASGTAITGWAWSNTIGWVSFSGTAADSSTYGVTVGAGGTLSGYAWSSSIGWINFGANSCGATPTLSNGTLTGWAQAIDTGSDGCISLGGTAGDSTPYSVTLSGTTFTGFAWASDSIGWLSFSGTAADSSPYAVVYGGSPAPTCSITSITPNPVATASTININYSTTRNPTTGTITDPSNATVTSNATASSGTVEWTSPSSAGSYTTYSMTVTSPSGSGTCNNSSAPLVVEVDSCQNITGLQYNWSDPNGYISGGNCLCNSGYTLSGTQCVASNPSITNFSGPIRVRSGSPATLSYTVINPPASCSITGTNGYNSGPFSPTSGVQGQVTTTAITSNTTFTLTCGSVSSSINVGITPAFQEQ